MTHASLFSGIGGFDLAAEWMGWKNVFHCEINEFCNKVLNYYWPDAKSYTDIKTTNFSIWRGKVDIVTGGFPCQPYSQAGKRKGKADDRHLWPQMLRAIREIQPVWVVGENVPGLLNWERGMVLAEIYADLEAAGFEVFPPVILPACGKNAPHRRDRLWVVAYASSTRTWQQYGQTNESRQLFQTGEREENKQFDQSISESRITTNAGLLRSKEHEKQTTGIEQCDKGDAADTKEQRLQKRHGESTRNGSHATIKRHSSFSQWQDFPTQPPVCSRNDGLPSRLAGVTISKHRTESIKSYGNSIVPQVAYEIFKVIQLLNEKSL